MAASLPSIPKLHRQATTFPALMPGGRAVSVPPWSGTWNRVQTGRLATGGCLYGGQTATFWAPLRDLLHITHGPVGCGVFALANRTQQTGPVGIDRYTGLNLGTGFQERDVVFGGENKLEQAVAEAAALFPLNNGITLLSTCPIALIGDDIDAVARRQRKALSKPVVPVQCAGFRRGDGVGETHATIAGTWSDWAGQADLDAPWSDTAHDITLLCREMNGAWRGIARLLEQIGLRVVARWPAGGDRTLTARLGTSQLCIGIGMEYWAKRLQQQFGVPWIEADFLGAGATVASLRAIAAHFMASDGNSSVGRRVEALIARMLPQAQVSMASSRDRVAGRLYLSFAPLQPAELQAYTDFGIRAGSVQQGWPNRQGIWQPPATDRRYQEMAPQQIDAVLQEAQPDLLGGLGGDAASFQKRGYAILDERSSAVLAGAATGFDGVPQLALELQRLFDAPLRSLIRPPWSNP